MAQFTSITQAARNAIAVWLSVELEPTGVIVEPRWFEVDRPLPPKAISVIDAGPRKVDWTDPEQLIVTPGAPGLVTVTWGLGYLTQRIQLDVWAQSDVELDDLIARLDDALNAGQRALGTVTNADPCGVGLLLNLGDGWAPGTVDFTFDEPSVEQTADMANQAEWHAMYRGDANMRLVQVATSPAMARIALKQKLGSRDTTVDADTPADT